MSEPVEQTPAFAAAPRSERDARAHRAMREARIEAVVAVGTVAALIVGLAVVDKAKGWQIVDLPWWGWLLLAAPALVLMILLLAVPLAELSPGRVRNAGVVLLGLMAAATRSASPCSSRPSRAAKRGTSAPATCSPTASSCG